MSAFLGPKFASNLCNRWGLKNVKFGKMHINRTLYTFRVDTSKAWKITQSSWLLGAFIRLHLLLLIVLAPVEVSTLSMKVSWSERQSKWIPIWISYMIFDSGRLFLVSRANLASTASKLFLSLLLCLISSVYLVLILYADEVLGVDLGLEATQVSLIIGALSLCLCESALVAFVLFSILYTKLHLYRLFAVFFQFFALV